MKTCRLFEYTSIYDKLNLNGISIFWSNDFFKNKIRDINNHLSRSILKTTYLIILIKVI